MLCNYENIKMNIGNNNYKGLRNVTSQFYACENIETQKKILVLLLRNVRKSVLVRYRVLGEYNLSLTKINTTRIKEEVHDLLHQIYREDSVKKDLDEESSIRPRNIQVCKFNYIKFEEKELKTSKGYVFIDCDSLVFYTPLENYVISFKSINKVEKIDSICILNLKNGKRFEFNLDKERHQFIERLRKEFKFELKETKIKEDLCQIQHIRLNTPLNSPQKPVLKDKQVQKEVTDILTRRTSLNENKLKFHSECSKSFGKNLKIKIKQPKKEIFSEDLKKLDEEIKEIDVEEAFNKEYEEVPKVIKKERVNPLDNKHVKKIKSSVNTTEENKEKIKLKLPKNLEKMLNALTRKRIRNLNNLMKMERKRIKQRGKSLELVLKCFVRKYFRLIKRID